MSCSPGLPWPLSLRRWTLRNAPVIFALVAVATLAVNCGSGLALSPDWVVTAHLSIYLTHAPLVKEQEVDRWLLIGYGSLIIACIMDIRTCLAIGLSTEMLTAAGCHSVNLVCMVSSLTMVRLRVISFWVGFRGTVFLCGVALASGTLSLYLSGGPASAYPAVGGVSSLYMSLTQSVGAILIAAGTGTRTRQRVHSWCTVIPLSALSTYSARGCSEAELLRELCPYMSPLSCGKHEDVCSAHEPSYCTDSKASTCMADDDGIAQLPLNAASTWSVMHSARTPHEDSQVAQGRQRSMCS